MKLTEAFQQKQLSNIHQLYEKTFPADEKKPFAVILQKRDEGMVEILSIEDDNGKFLGLAITVLYDDLVLLDYFAISPEQRSMGIGTIAIQLLKCRYSGKRFILEIERTDTEAANVEERKRRKAFYQKNGMITMPFLVKLFGVEMEILANSCSLDFDEYHRIYDNVFGIDIGRKVQLVEK